MRQVIPGQRRIPEKETVDALGVAVMHAGKAGAAAFLFEQALAGTACAIHRAALPVNGGAQLV
jgi:hypothetical protein